MVAKSPLRLLSEIIASSVDAIEGRFEDANLEYPNLDVPFNPILPSEALAGSPEVVEAAKLAVSACAHLTAMIHLPAMVLYDASGGFHVSSCVRVACEGNIAEILREAGPDGLHAKGIAAINGLDPVIISRVLRVLATHHIFREVSPDVFTNNRLSSFMDTQKSVDAIKASPQDKHIGTFGTAALLEHITDEMFKGSAIMTETILDPDTGHSDAQEHSAAVRALNTDKKLFEWYEQSENKYRFQRLLIAMSGSQKFDPPNAILVGFDWSALSPKSVVVDVGGGIGSTATTIARKYPHLRYVVQDRPAVIEDATAYCKRELPNAWEDGSITLEVHDYFTPQPQRDVSVFLLRMIIHDHGRAPAVKILKNLRAAAAPNTKLLIVEQIVQYACSEDPAVGKEIPGAEIVKSPSPLLSNLGKANAIQFLGDMQMYISFKGEERTLGSFVEVTRESGWTIQQVFTIPGSMHKQIVAVPTTD